MPEEQPRLPFLDPSLFRAEAVPPDVQTFNQKIEATLAQDPSPEGVPTNLTQSARQGTLFELGLVFRSERATERTIPGPAGDLTLRQVVPAQVRGAYLHFHTGLWTMGHPRDEDARAERLATACGLAVVSPHYRLAPQRPYPAGPDDAEAAAAWLLANAAREFGTDRLIIGGTSAGAHLAALTLLRLRDRNGRTGFAAADLAYGIYDLGLTPSARNWGERKLILNTPRLEWAVRQFLPTGDPRRPEISPLYAGLAGLPPALFTVGTLDPVLDDTLFLWSRWCAAGNRGELAVYPGGCHAFDHLPGPLAPQAHARTAAFLRQALEAP